MREISRFHRVHGSPGFAAAAEHDRRRSSRGRALRRRGRALPGGREDALRALPELPRLESRLRDARRGLAARRIVESFPDLPVALADYSQDADVDGGARRRRRGHRRERLRRARTSAERSCWPTATCPRCTAWRARSAARRGSCRTFPNQTTAWSGDDRDLVRWGHLSPYQTREPLRVHAVEAAGGGATASGSPRARRSCSARASRAKMVPATYDVVVATIPGTDRGGRRDRPDGAPLPRVRGRQRQRLRQRGDLRGRARAARRDRAEDTLPRRAGRSGSSGCRRSPARRRTSSAIPRSSKRLVAGIHMDMVGGLLATTKGTFHLSRTAETLARTS